MADIGFGDGLDSSELLGFEVESPGKGKPSSGENPSEGGAKAEAKTEPVESKEKATETPAPASGRDEKGRFVSPKEEKELGGTGMGPASGATEAKAPSEGSGEETRETGEIAATVKGVRPGPVEVFGKSYPDLVSAFHAVKSVAGQTRSMQERQHALETEIAELKASLEKAKGTPASAGAPADGSTAAEKAKGEPRKLVDVVDWGFIEKLSNDPEYGPAKAIQYAMQELQGYLDGEQARVREEVLKNPALEERLKPIEELHRTNQEAKDAFDVFSNLQSRVDPDGKPTFPMIQDEGGDLEFTKRVLERWKNNPALRSQGEYGAYLAYIDEERWNRHLAASLPDAVPPSKDIETKLESQNARMAASVTQGGGSTPLPSGKPRRSFAETFKRSLYEGTEKEDASILGF